MNRFSRGIKPQPSTGGGELRDNLNRLKAKYPNSRITQSYLRFEKSLQSTLTQIKFDVLQNEGSPNSTERRLAITDRFICTSWALYIQKAGTSTTATAAERAVAKLRTWPNPLIFTDSGVAANMACFYNGWLSATIDKDVIIEAFDTDRFLRVPDMQKGTSLYTSAPAAGLHQDDGWYDTHFAFAKLTPLLIFNGAGSNVITLNFPESVSMAGTTMQNFAVLKCRGYLAQNTSDLNGR